MSNPTENTGKQWITKQEMKEIGKNAVEVFLNKMEKFAHPRVPIELVRQTNEETVGKLLRNAILPEVFEKLPSIAQSCDDLKAAEEKMTQLMKFDDLPNNPEQESLNAACKAALDFVRAKIRKRFEEISSAEVETNRLASAPITQSKRAETANFEALRDQYMQAGNDLLQSINQEIKTGKLHPEAREMSEKFSAYLQTAMQSLQWIQVETVDKTPTEYLNSNPGRLNVIVVSDSNFKGISAFSTNYKNVLLIKPVSVSPEWMKVFLPPNLLKRWYETLPYFTRPTPKELSKGIGAGRAHAMRLMTGERHFHSLLRTYGLETFEKLKKGIEECSLSLIQLIDHVNGLTQTNKPQTLDEAVERAENIVPFIIYEGQQNEEGMVIPTKLYSKMAELWLTLKPISDNTKEKPGVIIKNDSAGEKPDETKEIKKRTMSRAEIMEILDAKGNDKKSAVQFSSKTFNKDEWCPKTVSSFSELNKIIAFIIGSDCGISMFPVKKISEDHDALAASAPVQREINEKALQKIYSILEGKPWNEEQKIFEHYLSTVKDEKFKKIKTETVIKKIKEEFSHPRFSRLFKKHSWKDKEAVHNFMNEMISAQSALISKIAPEEITAIEQLKVLGGFISGVKEIYPLWLSVDNFTKKEIDDLDSLILNSGAALGKFFFDQQNKVLNKNKEAKTEHTLEVEEKNNDKESKSSFRMTREEFLSELEKVLVKLYGGTYNGSVQMQVGSIRALLESYVPNGIQSTADIDTFWNAQKTIYENSERTLSTLPSNSTTVPITTIKNAIKAKLNDLKKRFTEKTDAAQSFIIDKEGFLQTLESSLRNELSIRLDGDPGELLNIINLGIATVMGRIKIMADTHFSNGIKDLQGLQDIRKNTADLFIELKDSTQIRGGDQKAFLIFEIMEKNSLKFIDEIRDRFTKKPSSLAVQPLDFSQESYETPRPVLREELISLLQQTNAAADAEIALNESKKYNTNSTFNQKIRVAVEKFCPDKTIIKPEQLSAIHCWIFGTLAGTDLENENGDMHRKVNRKHYSAVLTHIKSRLTGNSENIISLEKMPIFSEEDTYIEKTELQAKIGSAFRKKMNSTFQEMRKRAKNPNILNTWIEKSQLKLENFVNIQCPDRINNIATLVGIAAYFEELAHDGNVTDLKLAGFKFAQSSDYCDSLLTILSNSMLAVTQKKYPTYPIAHISNQKNILIERKAPNFWEENPPAMFWSRQIKDIIHTATNATEDRIPEDLRETQLSLLHSAADALGKEIDIRLEEVCQNGLPEYSEVQDAVTKALETEGNVLPEGLNQIFTVYVKNVLFEKLSGVADAPEFFAKNGYVNAGMAEGAALYQEERCRQGVENAMKNKLAEAKFRQDQAWMLSQLKIVGREERLARVKMRDMETQVQNCKPDDAEALKAQIEAIRNVIGLLNITLKNLDNGEHP